jgi:hypothetical protein
MAIRPKHHVGGGTKRVMMLPSKIILMAYFMLRLLTSRRPIRRDVEGNAEDDDSDEYWEGTDVTGTNFCGADLRGADLCGLDLSKSRGLSRDQIAVAIIDAHTRLPME